jgi:putative DNA primase/helicase
MAGPQIIALDNVSRAVNGDLLNQVLTQQRVNPRRLGKSENVEIRCTAFMLMNGNNLAIPADMARRVLLCSLDTKSERPESRSFAFDPLAMVRDARGEYVAAGLTVLRGYIAASRPADLKPLGSFEAWSSLVRGALVWLGESDPVESMDAVRAADPHRQQACALMAQWDECLGNARVTVAGIIAAATVPRAAPEFREALLAVAGEHGAISGIRLGQWLGRNKGRIVDGRSFQTGAQRKGALTWILQGARDVATDGNVQALHALM